MNKTYKDHLCQRYGLESIQEDGLDYVVTIRFKESADINKYFDKPAQKILEQQKRIEELEEQLAIAAEQIPRHAFNFSPVQKSKP
jgi:hypothetical protein